MKRWFPKFFSTHLLDGSNARQVLDCGSPLPLLIYGEPFEKRQRTGALQDAGATAQAPVSSQFQRLWDHQNSRTTWFALLLFSIPLAGCGTKHGNPQDEAANLPAAIVQVRTVERQPRASTEAVVGTVQARLHATLEAKISGHIEQLPIVLGQRVKAGERVALLGSSDLKARLDQAEATREQAQRDWNRLSALFQQQAATRAEYDGAEARKRVADAAVAEAKAMLEYAQIVAPFDGVVTRKYADVGDLALPGKPLADIEDPAQLRVQADVPDFVAAHVREGESLAVRVDALNGEITGTVAEISPAADPITHTVRVKVDLPATPGLRSGQFARLEVPLGESDALLVPESAVVDRGQMEILFVVANRHAQLRLVKTGRHTGGQVEILSGLDPGDVVVIQGASPLTDGQPVEAR